MINKKKLEYIIRKINNRCNPHECETFYDLLEQIKETSSGESSFFTPEEIEWVKSEPKIEDNIIKMCQYVWNKESVEVDYKKTISYILSQLDFTCENSLENKILGRRNMEFLTTPESIAYKDTIEESLILLDMSIIPYR